MALLGIVIALGLALLLVHAVGNWGPGSHLEYAHRVHADRRRGLLGRAADLLEREEAAFFYGNLAADLIHFKGYGGHRNHCHRWTIIAEMRAKADSDAEAAFVLGYLAHLAADTIAHNHYVPYHLARFARSRGLGHLYWEMRADHFVPEERWRLLAELKADRGLVSLDALVDAAVPRKALSMRANRMLFHHVLLIGERDAWRRRIERLHERAPSPLEEAFLERFRAAAVERVRLALGSGGLERLAHVDTNGKAAQREACSVRRRLAREVADEGEREEAERRLAERFLQGMESPPEGSGRPVWR